LKRTLRTLLVLTLVLGLMAGLMSVAEAKTATRITMGRRTLSMDWGTRYTLTVTVTPTNASDKSAIVWGSSDPALIQVQADTSSRKALVTVRAKASLDEPYPLAPVVITTTTSMGKTATCAITLKQIDVKSISVSPSSKAVYLTQSQPTYQMPKPTFNPSLAGDQLSYTWSTSNAAVATVDAATGLVTFTGEGTARIIATYTSGAVVVSDYCTFTVKPIRVKSISLDKTTLYMGQGKSFQLTEKLISAVSGKIPSYDKVTWTSADESIAKVDKDDGTVTAQSNSGKVKITASVDKGNYVKTASCLVYVRDASPVRVTITAGGDCVLGGDPRKSGITARSTQARYQSLIRANGPTYPFEKITKLFGPTGGTGAPNLSIVNLEVCLTTKGGSNPTTDRKFVFRGDPSNAQAFAVGIDIANIANNHSADFGMSSFDNTASSVKKYSDAEPSGYNQPLQRRQLRTRQGSGRQTHRLLRHSGQPGAAVSGGKPHQEGQERQSSGLAGAHHPLDGAAGVRPPRHFHHEGLLPQGDRLRRGCGPWPSPARCQRHRMLQGQVHLLRPGQPGDRRRLQLLHLRGTD